MLLPLLIATLMHTALIVPLSIPGCTNATAGDDDAAEQPQQTEKQQSTFTVDIADELRILPRTLDHSPDAICDPGAIPEWYRFDIRAGPVGDRIRQVTRQSLYGVMLASDFVEGKSSRALHGWFRPYDAVRLLAGDAGLCAVDWGDTIGIHPCYDSEAPMSRASEPLVRQEWKPPVCAPSKPVPPPVLVA
jgi:hypothetical protein